MDSRGITPEAVNTLTYIGALTDKATHIELALKTHVAYARAQGASWRMIGVALGTSTQAAWEKYRTPTPQGSNEQQLGLWNPDTN